MRTFLTQALPTFPLTRALFLPLAPNAPYLESTLTAPLGNLDLSVTEDELRARFSAFGPIERVNMLPQKNCGFVNFVNLESALKAKVTSLPLDL